MDCRRAAHPSGSGWIKRTLWEKRRRKEEKKKKKRKLGQGCEAGRWSYCFVKPSKKREIRRRKRGKGTAPKGS
jgi:hypothetical protein